ncbi:hypothetical protein Enr17x_37540 [Gimesia fumaroli]|uniref:Uncharacterized protein n=1 Tax=Gimesia fumaroli TaxID=2527976 RepID=A0A518IF27_9PLAN|nr:hypothetical protein Enr17x_37540 [Gimesia fumaroli]
MVWVTNQIQPGIKDKATLGMILVSYRGQPPIKLLVKQIEKVKCSIIKSILNDFHCRK